MLNCFHKDDTEGVDSLLQLGSLTFEDSVNGQEICRYRRHYHCECEREELVNDGTFTISVTRLKQN